MQWASFLGVCNLSQKQPEEKNIYVICATFENVFGNLHHF
jgi:hypothetical protein